MSPCCHISREEPLFCFRIIPCHAKQFPFLQKAQANKFVVNSGNRQTKSGEAAAEQRRDRESFPSEIPAQFEKTVSHRLFFYFLKHENGTNIFRHVVSGILLETFIPSLKLTVSVLNVLFLCLFCFLFFFAMSYNSAC